MLATDTNAFLPKFAPFLPMLSTDEVMLWVLLTRSIVLFQFSCMKNEVKPKEDIPLTDIFSTAVVRRTHNRQNFVDSFHSIKTHRFEGISALLYLVMIESIEDLDFDSKLFGFK